MKRPENATEARFDKLLKAMAKGEAPKVRKTEPRPRAATQKDEKPA